MHRERTTRNSIRYGPFADQEGDLHLPTRPRPPVVCLLHGGFWRMPYGRDQMAAIAEDLAARGLAVWNLEYRRLGGPQGGWPGTFDDVATGIDHLAVLAAEGIDLDLNRVIVVGHSAGGQLALWSAARKHSRATNAPRVSVAGVAGLAPIADLGHAYAIKVGGEAVAELLGGTPSQHPERCRVASPIELLPLGVRQLILHGTDDEVVPVDIARRYARAAKAAGDTVEFVELPHGGHMEYLDPGSEAHASLCRWLASLTRERA